MLCVDIVTLDVRTMRKEIAMIEISFMHRMPTVFRVHTKGHHGRCGTRKYTHTHTHTHGAGKRTEKMKIHTFVPTTDLRYLVCVCAV